MKNLFSLTAAVFLTFSAFAAYADECGQPVSNDAQPRAVDALHILKSSVGMRGCTLGACDVNSDCRISVVDAFGVLAAAVGRPASMDCDSTCPTDIPCEEAGAPICNGICPADTVCTTRDAGDVDPDERATVCHIPPGNPDNEHTIVVGLPSVSAHLRHGDYLGPCESDVEDCDPEATDCGTAGNPALAGDVDEDSDSDGDDLECFCMPVMVSTTTTLSEPTTTTTVTTTTTSTTTTTVESADADNDGLLDDSDPCPQDARNACFGQAAVDETTEREIRINANASGTAECWGERTDCNGDLWYADYGYNEAGGNFACDLGGGGAACVIGGLTAIFGCESEMTADLLRCEHFDLPEAPDLVYTFDVPAGDYLVNLFFANTFSGTPEVGDRIFDIVVQGDTAYAGFDQVEAAGGSGTAVVRSAQASVVADEGLTISFGRILENPAIKAIEVLAQAAP